MSKWPEKRQKVPKTAKKGTKGPKNVIERSYIIVTTIQILLMTNQYHEWREDIAVVELVVSCRLFATRNHQPSASLRTRLYQNDVDLLFNGFHFDLTSNYFLWYYIRAIPTHVFVCVCIWKLFVSVKVPRCFAIYRFSIVQRLMKNDINRSKIWWNS